jgi:hypothetical protein
MSATTSWLRRAVPLAAVLGVYGAAVRVQSARVSSAGQPSGAALHWYKGNTHTHTLNSDGDSTPDDVTRWYREHGYRFLVLSDHNFLTSVDGLNALHGADERFLLIRGEEITDRFGDAKPIHINGLGLNETVAPQHGSSVADVVQRNVDAIRKAGGIPHVNHPNFMWAISGGDLQQIERLRLLEIFNGHPIVNNLGGGGVPGMEDVWDRLLSNGRQIYGIADDDAHTFKEPGNPDVAGPGRGWVVVRAERLAARPILDALERGDFYASTGVELADYQVTDTALTITIKEKETSKYRVQFVGRNGRILKETTSSPASYAFAGGEGYVRAKVIESNGRLAWTQPVIK